MLVQIHIPKCAGTSVGSWLRMAAMSGGISGYGALYPEGPVFTDDDLSSDILADSRVQALSSHNIRRFAVFIGDRHMRYFTILRQPAAHALSVIRYMMQEREAYGLPPEAGWSSRSVAAWFLDRPIGTTLRENTQTNHLALYPWCDATEGRCDPARYGSWDSGDQRAYERERLDVAKGVLRSFFTVGTVERFDETLELLRARSAAIGLYLPPVGCVPRLNVTRAPIDDVSWIENEPLGQRLHDSLADDRKLYAFAGAMLDGARP